MLKDLAVSELYITKLVEIPVLIDQYQPWSGPGSVAVDQYGHLY